MAKDLERILQLREDSLPLWRFAREVWDIQDLARRLVLSENPWTSQGLNLTFMQQRPNLNRADVCQ